MASMAGPRRWVWMLAWLGCGVAAHAATPAPPLPEFPAPTTATIAALRAQFQAHGSIAAIDEAGAAAISVRGEHDQIDAQVCRRQAAALDAAARHDPLSLAVWYFKHRCAQALGDAAQASQSEAAFAIVLRDLLDGLPQDGGQTPIRIGAAIEGTALILASGKQVVQSWFDLSSPSQGLIWRVVLRDPRSGHERSLSFDMQGARLSLVRDPQAAQSPLVRMSAFEDGAKDTYAGYRDHDQLPSTLERLSLEDPQRRAALLKAFAAKDSASAAIVLADYCVPRANLACTGMAVDRLLGYAEKGEAQPMVMLAWAYARAGDIKRDQVASRKLLLGAASRIGTGAAFADYLRFDDVAYYLDPEWAQWALPQLVTAAGKGDALAAGVALQLDGQLAAGHLDSARAKAMREQVRAAGLGYFDALGRMHAAIRDKDGVALVDAATALYGMRTPGGVHALAARNLGFAYLGGYRGVDPDFGKALEWFGRAGMGGDVPSMRIVAGAYADRSAHPEARSVAAKWLAAAILADDADALLAFARLSEVDPPGIQFDQRGKRFGAAEAASSYRELIDGAPDSAAAGLAARRLASMLIEGRGVPRDAGKARALLEARARRGDGLSALVLAQDLYAGRLGARDAGAAKAWIDKALAKPDPETQTVIADALFMGFDLPTDRVRALALWKDATSHHLDEAWNDMAWALCTTPDASARDAVRGLDAISHLVPAGAQPTRVDTLAACQAAHGDFAAATASQQRAIAGVDPLSDTAARMAERLALYRAQRIYVQSPKAVPERAPKPGATPAPPAHSP